MKSDATISPCGKYRYRLSRVWGEGPERRVFVMLNPSTADAEHDDPTIRRCIAFAQAWGDSGLEVVNLFALRATDPRELKKAGAIHAIGPENDAHLLAATAMAGDRWVIAAWGTGGTLYGRDKQVRRLLAGRLAYLRLTKDGHPAHPLRLPKHLEPATDAGEGKVSNG